MNKPFSTPHDGICGAISGLYGDVLQGWALDPARPDERLVIEVHVDGACVALVRADQFQPEASQGDAFHGFSVQLRQSWLDGARRVGAVVANHSVRLDGELSLPTAPPTEPAAVASQVWHNGGLLLSGWSFDPSSPQRHVHISVREDSQVVANAICNTHHHQLSERPTTDHGFSLDLPWSLADGKVHKLHIENDLGQPLTGSPITLCCWPEGLEGLLKQHDLHGPDEPTLALLNQVAHEQSLRSPKSAGFHHYADWFEVFQQQEAPASPVIGKTGVLLISEGDLDREAVSLANIRAQRNVSCQIATAPDHDLLPALKQLLAGGCQRIIPLLAGDRLAANGLATLSTLIDDDTAWAYADCDRDGPNGERTLPWLKPVWDVDAFIGADIFSPGAIFSAGILDKALSALAPAEELHSLDWHYLMAGIALVSEQTAARVAHLPRVLYHRHRDSAASPERNRPSMDRHQAIAWMCQQLTPGAIVRAVPEYPALLRAQWPLPVTLPRVSILVPTRDQLKLLRTCIDGLLNHTDYPGMEIIVVDNQSSDPDTLLYMEELPRQGIKVLPHPYPFNYSAINNHAVEHASGELICLLNNDIEIIETGWLKEMVSQLLRHNVGAVGAKLLWPNRMVQHGGVVVGINGLAAHAGNNLEEHDAGYLATNQITRRQSAVTAACLLLRKSVYQEIGGLDEYAFPVAFNDVDLCLRIREQGLNLIWSAAAQLIHAESASRGKDQTPEKRSRAMREQQGFIERWALGRECDPYYHPALSHDYLSGAYGGLGMPPRLYGLRTIKFPDKSNGTTTLNLTT